MIESIQHFANAPVPSWLFDWAVAILWYRDWGLTKGLKFLAQILDDNHISSADQSSTHDYDTNGFTASWISLRMIPMSSQTDIQSTLNEQRVFARPRSSAPKPA